MEKLIKIIKPLRIQAMEDDFIASVWRWLITGVEREYLLIDDCEVLLDAETFVAPKNMIFDGASIPRLFWSLVGNPYSGPQRYAAVIHDAAYKRCMACDDAKTPKDTTRSEADKFFRQMLIARGATRLRAWLMWAAVRIFGRKAWRRRL